MFMRNFQDEFSKQLQSLLSKLQEVESRETDPVKRFKDCIKLCLELMSAWRQSVGLHGFPHEDGEIWFFKQAKPRLLGQYLYYQRVLQLHLDEWKGASINQEQRLIKEMEHIEQVFEQNRSLWQYYRSGDTSLDRAYFMRGQESWLFSFGQHHFDESFSTRCDGQLAALLSMDLYSEYIGRRLAGDEDRVIIQQSSAPAVNVVSTRTATQLTVIGISLYESGVYDRSQLSREAAMAHWGKCWNADLRNHRQIAYRLKGQQEPDRILKDMLGGFNDFLGGKE